MVLHIRSSTCNYMGRFPHRVFSSPTLLLVQLIGLGDVLVMKNPHTRCESNDRLLLLVLLLLQLIVFVLHVLYIYTCNLNDL